MELNTAEGIIVSFIAVAISLLYMGVMAVTITCFMAFWKNPKDTIVLLGLALSVVMGIVTFAGITVISNKTGELEIVTLKLTEPRTNTTVHYDDQDYVLFINEERHTVSFKTYNLYDMGDTIKDYFIEVEDIDIDLEPNSRIEIPKK